jgi:hypothetical protein
MRSCTYTNLCLVRQMLLARQSMLPIAILLSKQGYKLRASSVYIQQTLCLASIIANYGQTAPPRVTPLQSSVSAGVAVSTVIRKVPIIRTKLRLFTLCSEVHSKLLIISVKDLHLGVRYGLKEITLHGNHIICLCFRP